MTFHIAYNILSTSVCLLICIFQTIAALCHWQHYPWNSDTSLVLLVIFTIFIANLSCCIFGLLLTFAIPNCNTCKWAGIVIQVLYSTSKLSTYLFYLQRAKLAQLFRRKIPNYYFNTIFPTIFFVIYLVFLLLFALEPDARDRGHCQNTNSNIPFIKHETYYVSQWCVLDTSHSRFYISSGLVVEVSVILFFTYLFSSPFIDMLQPKNKDLNGRLLNKDCDILDDEMNTLWHVDLRKKTNILNSARIQKDDNSGIVSDFSMFITTKKKKNSSVQTLKAQQAEIKNILTYNIILSLIGFIFSSFTMILWPINAEKFWMIPWTDYCINSLTTFLMLSRNRSALQKFIGGYCCGCCQIHIKKISIYKRTRNGETNCRNKIKFGKYTKSVIQSSSDDSHDTFSSTNNYYHHIGEQTYTQNSINHESSLTL